MQKSEYMEIARILQQHNVVLSSNRSGIYFDMAALPQAAFDALLQFHEFVKQNNQELKKRETTISTR